MIANLAEIKVALNLTGEVTATQLAQLTLAMAAGHAAVRKYLGYNPEQKDYANQLYPRAEFSGIELWDGVWDKSGGRAVFEGDDSNLQYLQLEHLPVRSVSEVRVDPSGRFGQGSGDFGTGTIWAAGSQYYVEWDTANVSRTGQLLAVSAWPIKPGTVRVSYRAGYSPREFASPATESETDANGFITTQGVDASPIKAACLLECMRGYHTFVQFSQSSLTGLLVPGPKQSETLGSYSYSLASGAAAALLTSMATDISPQAAGLLDEFAHYGRMLL